MRVKHVVANKVLAYFASVSRDPFCIGINDKNIRIVVKHPYYTTSNYLEYIFFISYYIKRGNEFVSEDCNIC